MIFSGPLMNVRAPQLCQARPSGPCPLLIQTWHFFTFLIVGRKYNIGWLLSRNRTNMVSTMSSSSTNSLMSVTVSRHFVVVLLILKSLWEPEVAFICSGEKKKKKKKSVDSVRSFLGPVAVRRVFANEQ